jgi:hypothetical protein
LFSLLNSRISTSGVVSQARMDRDCDGIVSEDELCAWVVKENLAY